MNYYYILKEYEHNLMYIEDILKTSSTTNNFKLKKLCKKYLAIYSLLFLLLINIPNIFQMVKCLL